MPLSRVDGYDENMCRVRIIQNPSILRTDVYTNRSKAYPFHLITICILGRKKQLQIHKVQITVGNIFNHLTKFKYFILYSLDFSQFKTFFKYRCRNDFATTSTTFLFSCKNFSSSISSKQFKFFCTIFPTIQTKPNYSIKNLLAAMQQL